MANNSQAEKSKRILGTGIFLTGLVMLVIGIIIGVRFPKYVLSHVKEHACVTRRESQDYQEWVHGGGRIRYNRLYVMDLVNSDAFLSKGEEPKFQRRGPYVYQEEETKINITFSGRVVTFRLWTMQTFRPDLTSRECGADCNPSNKVTVVNPVFLQIVQPFGNKVNFYNALIPRLMRNVRNALTMATPDRSPTNNNAIKKQSLTSTPSPSSPLMSSSLSDFLPTKSIEESTPPLNLQMKSRLASPLNSRRSDVNGGALFSLEGVDVLRDFDSWIALNDTVFKQKILRDSNVTAGELPSVLVRLYETLGSASKFGVQFLRNESLAAWCETHLAEFIPAINQNCSEALQPHLVRTAAKQCGVLFYLQRLGRQTAPTAHFVLPFISTLFCVSANPDDYCWYPMTVSDYELRNAYVESVRTYVIDHIHSAIATTTELDTESTVVTSLPIGHLALGYTTSLKKFIKGGRGSDSNLSMPLKLLTTQQFFVRGILAHQSNVSDVNESSAFRLTLRTCLWDRSSKNNFILHAFEAPSASWLDTDRSERRSSFRPSSGGLTFKVAPAPALSACRAAPPAKDLFLFYVTDLGRGHEFVRASYDSVEGAYVLDYKPEHQVRYGKKCSNYIFETTCLLGFQSWTHFPLRYHFGSSSPAQNRISIEPVSGEIWRYSSVVHVQAGIRPFPSSSSSVPSQWRKVSFYWLRREQEVSPQRVTDYQTEVAVMMRSSCGGLVSLVLAGLVVMMLGLAVVLVHPQDNRVGPDARDSTEGLNTF